MSYLSLLGFLKRNSVSPENREGEKHEKRRKEEKEEKERRRRFLSRLCKQSMKVNQGKLIVKGVLHRAGALNSNGRVYPKSILTREVHRFVEEKVHQHASFGELFHPRLSCENFRTINVARISHQLLELHWEEDTLMGTIEVLDTPQGRTLRKLYRRGECESVGVSSRGWATLLENKENGSMEVGDDFDLITFDYVSQPSTPGAFLLPIPFVYTGTLPDQKEITKLAKKMSKRDKKQKQQNNSKSSGRGGDGGGGLFFACFKGTTPSRVAHMVGWGRTWTNG